MKKIKGKTFQSFIPVFLKFNTSGKTISSSNVITISNILTAYAQLCLKNTEKINVLTLVSQSGYSRTTFYSYFTNMDDVRKMLEDIISLHIHMNADIYFECFMGELSPEEERTVLLTIADFSPYINALLQRFPDYRNRYTEDFNAILSKGIPQKDFNNLLPALQNALSTALVSLMESALLNHSDINSLTESLKCTKLLINNIFNRKN